LSATKSLHVATKKAARGGFLAIDATWIFGSELGRMFGRSEREHKQVSELRTCYPPATFQFSMLANP
jgi:hypothetical protein